MINKRTTALSGAIAWALVGLASPSFAGSSDEYYYIAVGEGAEMEFWENGNVKKLKGDFTLCTRSKANYDETVKSLAGLGLSVLTSGDGPPNPTVALDPQLYVKPPDFSYLEDTSGQMIFAYGVPVIMNRSASRDASMAAIAGNPRKTKFYAYESVDLGPDQRTNTMPLSSTFRTVFEWSSSALAPKASQFSDDPWVVSSDTCGEQGGSTTPAVSRIPVGDSAISNQTVREGYPANPCILQAGLMGPVIGGTWEPYVLSQGPQASVDVLTVSRLRGNSFVEGLGTVLTGGEVIFQQSRNHGDSFLMQIPNDPTLIGAVFTAQATVTLSGSTVATNAIDVVIGSRR